MAEKTRMVTFENEQGDRLAATLELPAGEHLACALFAHCFTCSKDFMAASRISRALRRAGLAVLRFDFTGLGNSEGDFANTDFSSNVQDLLAAEAFLRREVGAAGLLIGHSLGGAAVLVAADRLPDVRAVATIGAPSSPEHVRRLLVGDLAGIETRGAAWVEIGGRRFRIRRRFLEDLERHDLEHRLESLRAALLVFHAPDDGVVGIDHARALFERAPQPKSFLALEGADHLLTRPEDATFVASVLTAWVRRHLASAPESEPESPPERSVVVEESGGRLRQRIRAGRHELVADEPVSKGGGDEGPSPYELLLAALGACTSMTLRMYADHKQWPLEHVTVRLRHAKVPDEAQKARIDRIERDLEIRGALSEEQRARLKEIADRCPVHRTLHGEKQVVTRIDGEAGG